jgi:hypothetical protein
MAHRVTDRHIRMHNSDAVLQHQIHSEFSVSSFGRSGLASPAAAASSRSTHLMSGIRLLMDSAAEATGEDLPEAARGGVRGVPVGAFNLYAMSNGASAGTGGCSHCSASPPVPSLCVGGDLSTDKPSDKRRMRSRLRCRLSLAGSSGEGSLAWPRRRGSGLSECGGVPRRTSSSSGAAEVPRRTSLSAGAAAVERKKVASAHVASAGRVGGVLGVISARRTRTRGSAPKMPALLVRPSPP